MKLEDLWNVGPFLPEDRQILREILSAEPLQRALGAILGEHETSLTAFDLTTDVGVREALEAQGIERGITLCIEKLIELSEVEDGQVE